MFGIRDINSKKYKTIINYLGESTINQNNNNENTPATDSPEINPKPEKKWIWVKGYKGFNEQWLNGKLELTGRNSFVYNQDGETSIREYEDENNLKECETGLHFCTKLVNVFGFYSPIFNRITGYGSYGYVNVIGFYNTIFAEIEAEVEKDYYEKYKSREKLVARKIRITRILSNKEIFENLDDKYSCDSYFKTFEEFNYIKNALHEYTINNPDILESDSLALGRYIDGVAKELIKKRKASNVNILIEHGYSPTFARIIMDKYDKAFNDAIAYADEGLSPDMRAYLIVNSQE